MFERDAEIQAQIDELYDTVARPLKRGDIMMHDRIREVTGLSPHQKRWHHVVGRVRRRLQREKGIATYVRPQDVNVGYRLLTVVEQLHELPKWRAQKAGRQFRRARLSVAAIPDGGMSTNQRRMRNAAIQDLRDQERHARKMIQLREAARNGNFVVPRRPEFADRGTPTA